MSKSTSIISGIYKFENKINHHIYIGQSVDILSRYRDHLNRMKNNFASNSEYNSAIHCAMRKYGIENFTFEIIEECAADTNLLNEREIYWIAVYDSYYNGYNETPGGNQPAASTMKLNAEIVANIQQDLIDNLLNYDALHEKYQISTGRISEINTGKIWYNKNLQYPLRSRPQSKATVCPKCGKRKDKTAQLCQACYTELKLYKYPVNREELKQLIRTQSFMAIGRQYNVTDNSVRKWCKHYNLPYRHQDIIKYSDEEWLNI